MKKPWFPIFLVVALLGLLAVLATLQYKWLGQISEAERERLERNLQSDTLRFAEDFNREIQGAYFNFQISGDAWRDKNWDEFNARFKFWSERTVYPELITEFYFVENQTVSRYNPQTKAFESTDWTENLNRLKPRFSEETKFQPIDEQTPALLMPVYDEKEKFDRILTVRKRTPTPEIRETRIPRTSEEEINIPPTKAAPPKKYGVLVIVLDENVIKERILPDLVKKYFAENESAKYKLAVVNEQNEAIFQTQTVETSDASAKFFHLASENFMFFANRELLSSIEGERKSSSMVFSKVEKTSRRNKEPQEKKSQLEVKVMDGDEAPRVRIFDGEIHQAGVWTLNVQHEDGSLAQYVNNTRRKNLGVSFGILSLLAASIVLIFVSAQRAKNFAQRQVDFVSSVSHEFRTPLAVIYSAGENLTDGVVQKERVAQYGNLIKREGRKLSAMVEQILEFAGARSGKRKFDFREANVREIIENALAECQPLIDEKGFTVEKEIAENLPRVAADETALTQAVQNLIANSIKYSNGEKWLKVSASNGDNKIKITVEDKGIGIEKSEIGKIFEPFFRAKSVVDAQIHGNGLGLSLVKQIVEAHKGKIKVESETGKGSTFTIELPQRN